MGFTSRPGRVAEAKIFGPTPRKKRLVTGPKEDVGEDAKFVAEAGAWLKSLREQRRLSQSEFCAVIRIEPKVKPPFISAIENGRTHLKPAFYRAWAEVLGLPPRDFVKQLTKFYSPITYELLLRDEDGPCG